MTKLWTLALKASKDDCIGLKAAAHINATTFHALGFAVLVSENLEQAFKRIQRFHKVVSDAISIQCETQDDTLIIDISTAHPDIRLSEQVVDMTMASGLVLVRAQLNAIPALKRAEFQRTAPRSTSLHEALFNCELHFSQTHNRLYFNAQQMRQPLPSANSQIAEHNDRLVADYLAKFEAPNYSHNVREQLITLLPSGDCSIENLAQALGTSPRSIHRRLQKEGTAYQDILRDLREQLAKHYLRDSAKSITDIAFQLGYNDASNFARAFKRWTRQSPNDYRSL